MKKRITTQQFSDIIDHIMDDSHDVAKQHGTELVGITQGDMIEGIHKRLGDDWVLTRDPPVRFTKEDISAVANSRFYRKTGVKLMMAWAIVILAFAMVSLTFRLIPLSVYYGLSIAATIGFIFSYSKKQAKIREELKQAVYGSDKVEADKG